MYVWFGSILAGAQAFSSRTALATPETLLKYSLESRVAITVRCDPLRDLAAARELT